MNCEEDRGRTNRLLPIEDKNEKDLLKGQKTTQTKEETQNG